MKKGDVSSHKQSRASRRELLGHKFTRGENKAREIQTQFRELLLGTQWFSTCSKYPGAWHGQLGLFSAFFQHVAGGGQVSLVSGRPVMELAAQ